MSPAKKNKAEATKAWVSEINKIIHQDFEINKRNILIPKFMWATDLRAIKAFKSLCAAALTLVSTDPIKAKKYNPNFEPIKILGHIKIKAKPPIFNSSAAKITDPPVGASTWALGNHIWKGKRGNFTKKGAKRKAPIRPENIDGEIKEKRFIALANRKKIGKTEHTVYSIK